MKETRWPVLGEHLEPNEPSSQTHSTFHLHTCDRRRVPELAAISKHGQRLRKLKRARIQAPHPRCQLRRDAPAPTL
jgi:hypothetical protein